MKKAEMSLETVIKFIIVIIVVAVLILFVPKMIKSAAEFIIKKWTPV